MTGVPYLMSNSSFDIFMQYLANHFSFDGKQKIINLNNLITQIILFIEGEFNNISVANPSWGKIYSEDFTRYKHIYYEGKTEEIEEIVKKEIEYFLIKISECCDPELIFTNNIDFNKLWEILAKIGVPINCKNGYFLLIDKIKCDSKTFIGYKSLLNMINEAQFHKMITFLDRPLMKRLCQLSF